MRSCYCFIGVLALTVQTGPAGVVNIDFNLGGTPTYSGLGAAADSTNSVRWNDLAVTGGSAPGSATASSTFAGLVFSDDRPSGLSVTVRRTKQSDLPAVGHSAADLLRDCVLVDSGNAGTRLSGTITLGGLTGGMAYDVCLYGAGSGMDEKTAFTIGPTTLQTTGSLATTTDLTAGEDYVRFDGILPDTNNQIVVTYANVIDGADPGSVGPVNGCQIVALPLLRIRPVGSSQLQLAWPAEAVDFHLETSTDLLFWDTVPDSPEIVGDEFVVALPITDPKRFFRLRQP